MAGVVTLDAGVLIALMNSQDAHHEWAVDLLKQTLHDELNMSVLTMAECLVAPERQGLGKKFAENIAKLEIKIEPLTSEASTHLASLRAQTNLRMPDAVALQAAQTRGNRLATTDKTLANQAATLGVAVLHPNWAK